MDNNIKLLLLKNDIHENSLEKSMIKFIDKILYNLDKYQPEYDNEYINYLDKNMITFLDKIIFNLN